jgi:hypothetical protein
MSGLLDGRGCLTEAGLAALAKAPPGRGPDDAAAHLASCARCQRRLLARGGAEAGAIRATPTTVEAPPLWRTGVVVLTVLLLVAVAMVGMRLIGG